MNVQRGDIVLAWYPFASGVGGKRRPCVVVQNDDDNRRRMNTVVAQITSNIARMADQSHFLIDVSTVNGQQSGQLHNSLVSCNNLATIEESLIDRVIGTLNTSLVHHLNDCLRSALGIV